MPLSPLDKLIGLALNAMGLDTGTGFEQRMTVILTRLYTAAMLVATAERLNVPVETLRGLSRAERGDIKRAVAAQLPYLAGFAAVYAQLSDAQRAARLALYAASVRPFYMAQRWAGWDIPDELLPGNQTCLGNCLCTGTIIDNGDGTGIFRRRLGPTDHSCQECKDLEGDHPIQRRAL